MVDINRELHERTRINAPVGVFENDVRDVFTGELGMVVRELRKVHTHRVSDVVVDDCVTDDVLSLTVHLNLLGGVVDELAKGEVSLSTVIGP